MKIRCYRPEDCDEIVRLFYDTVHTINARDYSPEQLAVWATGEVDQTRWNESFLANSTFVAEEDGVILGFGDMDKTGYLDRLYVHRDHQRQGIAGAICDALEKSVRAAAFTTHASITARPFFEGRGYQITKEQQVDRQGILLTNFVMKKPGMQRVLVIGCPGSGKSTFARALHDLTGLPLCHLDMLYWNPDRTVVPKEVFLRRLDEALAQRTWIIDGNYGSTMELRMKACDTIIFLDYPVELCVAGAKARVGKRRSDIPWIEEAPDPEFLEFIRSFPENGRLAILELLAKYSDKNTLVFHTRQEAERFLSAE